MGVVNRIVFNTGVLYSKLLITLVIGLFTTRLVLGALGETNYGIYTLVAGVVGMLAILQSSMAITSMRFMAHSLGTGDVKLIKKTFNTTLLIHLIIGSLLVLVMEIGGLLMFDHLLKIPFDKITDAKTVFHFMVVTTFVTVVAVPYDAVINAHEDLLALSIVDLVGVVLKLGIAVYLTYSAANLLVLYGFLMLLTQILMRIIKQLYSRVKYTECRISFRKYIDKNLIKPILSFTLWNLLGSIASITVTQIKSILLNMFFGVKINASDGISKTASSQINLVSTSMTRAINPQLVKSEGSGNRKRMLRITEISTKFSVFLFALFAIPVIIESPYLLNLWLKTVPEFAVLFSRLILVGLLIDKFTFEIGSAIRAVGKIRNFQIAETLIIVLNIPVTYFLFKKGYPPYTIFLVAIFITILIFFVRLYYGKVIANLNIKHFFKNGIFPVIIPILVTTLLSFLIQIYMNESFIRLCIIIITSVSSMTLLFRYFGLDEEELSKIKSVVNFGFKSLKNHFYC